MVELRIERENRIARLYFIQGICVEKKRQDLDSGCTVERSKAQR